MSEPFALSGLVCRLLGAMVELLVELRVRVFLIFMRASMLYRQELHGQSFAAIAVRVWSVVDIWGSNSLHSHSPK